MVYETYAKRQKRLRGEGIDIYTYDSFPKPFRVQVIYIWNSAFGDPEDYDRSNLNYKRMVEILRKEMGVFELPPESRRARSWKNELEQFLLSTTDASDVLNILELSFRMINLEARKYIVRGWHDSNQRIDNAISELNIRFKEHAIGFQFIDNELVRVDSELIHKQVVLPVLKLLSKPEYAGAEEEYRNAHEHYMHEKTKEALADCLKALESTMMVICKKRGWAYGEKDNAKTLIDICFKNQLIPDFWQSHFSGIRATLEGGVPTARNKLGGHGQGPEPKSVPLYLVGYAMHMTASTIKFLVEADESMA